MKISKSIEGLSDSVTGKRFKLRFRLSCIPIYLFAAECLLFVVYRIGALLFGDLDYALCFLIDMS